MKRKFVAYFLVFALIMSFIPTNVLNANAAIETIEADQEWSGTVTGKKYFYFTPQETGFYDLSMDIDGMDTDEDLFSTDIDCYFYDEDDNKPEWHGYISNFYDGEESALIKKPRYVYLLKDQKYTVELKSRGHRSRLLNNPGYYDMTVDIAFTLSLNTDEMEKINPSGKTTLTVDTSKNIYEYTCTKTGYYSLQINDPYEDDYDEMERCFYEIDSDGELAYVSRTSCEPSDEDSYQFGNNIYHFEEGTTYYFMYYIWDDIDSAYPMKVEMIEREYSPVSKIEVVDLQCKSSPEDVSLWEINDEDGSKYYGFSKRILAFTIKITRENGETKTITKEADEYTNEYIYFYYLGEAQKIEYEEYEDEYIPVPGNQPVRIEYENASLETTINFPGESEKVTISKLEVVKLNGKLDTRDVYINPDSEYGEGEIYYNIEGNITFELKATYSDGTTKTFIKKSGESLYEDIDLYYKGEVVDDHAKPGNQLVEFTYEGAKATSKLYFESYYDKALASNSYINDEDEHFIQSSTTSVKEYCIFVPTENNYYDFWSKDDWNKVIFYSGICDTNDEDVPYVDNRGYKLKAGETYCVYYEVTKEKGDTFTWYLGHNFRHSHTFSPWSEVELAENGKYYKTRSCLDCGYVDSEEHQHVYGDWETVVAATESKEGSEERRCDCGKKETRAIAKLSHTHIKDKGNTIAATCDKDGSITYRCSKCGEELEKKVIKAAGHFYDEGIVTKAATVFTSGEKVKTCSICKMQVTETTARLVPTIKLSKTKVTLKKGKKIAIRATKLAKGDKIIKWKSNKTKVATVTQKGKITAKKKGKATITVTLKSGKKAKIKVTVK